MDKNKMIILALIVIIAALLVGMAAMMMPNMNKQDTNLKFKSKSTLTEGDSLKIKLVETNGTSIANQTVNITIKDKGGSSDYHSVVTNSKGIGKLKLDKSAGKYTVTISYGGNDNFNGCNATKKITIKEEVVEAQTSSSSNSNVESSPQPSSWTDSEGVYHFYKNGQEYVGDPNAQHMDIDTWNYVGEHGMK